jgi:hypothetical protein
MKQANKKFQRFIGQQAFLNYGNHPEGYKTLT